MKELEELRGYAVGADLALVNAIRALIRTHPEPMALAHALSVSQQQGLVVLLGSGAPTDKAIADYHATWEALMSPWEEAPLATSLAIAANGPPPALTERHSANLRLVVLRISRPLGGFEVGQLRPDGLPVVRAKIAAGDGAIGGLFQSHRKDRGAGPQSVDDVL